MRSALSVSDSVLSLPRGGGGPVDRRHVEQPAGRSRALAEAQKVGGGLVEVGRVAGTLAHQIVRGLRGGLLPLPPLPPSEVQR